MRAFVRSSAKYPLLSGGRINLYSLFVESGDGTGQAGWIRRPAHAVGHLRRQDRGAVLQVSLHQWPCAGLFDFENRKIFFKDVHASFKFCVLIFGGKERTFDETECAFFLHDTDAIKDPDRCFPLAPSDFDRVNPNTGTAPIFRTRRDAEITRSIYERHPVLVDRSGGKEHRAWPVRYRQGLFNMTSDSHLFRTAAEQLDAEGFYPVQGNRWKKGEELYLPLYQGG